jgi:hypothetical protein
VVLNRPVLSCPKTPTSQVDFAPITMPQLVLRRETIHGSDRPK